MNVLSFGPLFAGYNFKEDILSFMQGFEAFAVNRRMMDKDILAGSLSDKAEASFVIPPFNFSTGHSFCSPVSYLEAPVVARGEQKQPFTPSLWSYQRLKSARILNRLRRDVNSAFRLSYWGKLPPERGWGDARPQQSRKELARWNASR